MKQNVISMSFTDGENEVSYLSKDLCRPDDVLAALQFLRVGCTLSVSIKEVDLPAQK